MPKRKKQKFTKSKWPYKSFHVDATTPEPQVSVVKDGDMLAASFSVLHRSEARLWYKMPPVYESEYEWMYVPSVQPGKNPYIRLSGTGTKGTWELRDPEFTVKLTFSKDGLYVTDVVDCR